MTEIVLDLETTVKCPHGTNKAHPFWHENYIVASGWMRCDDYIYHGLYYSDISVPLSMKEGDVLIGHNIKFDMGYLYHTHIWFKDNYHTIRVWDTQLAHYLLTGQEDMWPSLDTVAAYYGLPLKPDKIKEYWKNGVQTEDIPKNELMEYLEHDVLTTAQIYKWQKEEVEARGVERFFASQMLALMATFEMTVNGMAVEENILRDKTTASSSLLSMAKLNLDGLKPAWMTNTNSSQQLATYLYGGEIMEAVDEVVCNEDGSPYKYKTGKRKGQIKTKLVRKKVPVHPALAGVAPILTTKGKPKVDNTVLRDLLDTKLMSIQTAGFLRAVLQYREVEKDHKTYFLGYGSMVFEGFIHPSHNHCATATGRLSSSNPNMQNSSNKERT